METNTPNYGIYFDLDGIVAYEKSEFQTIKKIINNIINNRYYQLDLMILFNEEIPNYDGMRKQLSNNIMQIIGQIDDELVDDIIEEVKSTLAIDRVIRHRSSNTSNNTGFPDEELLEMYKEFIDEALHLEINDNENTLGILNKKFDYSHLPNLKENEYLHFCNLLLKNGDNLDSFEMLYDLKVVEACFKNFPYFIRYLDMINFKSLILYYKSDLYKIMRNIRFYVKQVSQVYNDNIKELFIYKFILYNKFNVEGNIYDPEEGLNSLREIFDEAIFDRDEELITDFENRVKLFKNDYQIITIGDSETKTFKEASRVANIIKRNVLVFDQLLEAFRKADDAIVMFNSKFNNTEEYRSFLDILKRSRLIKEYQEKYSLFTITLEKSAIPFLQGKWFEYYTSSVCEGIIAEYQKKGHNPNYGIYQNVIVEMYGVRRELDIIIYIDDLIYYIENKIEKKNTFKSDLVKYRQNSKNMNIDKNNCYLVYLNGDDSSLDDVRVCNIQTFVNLFKKGVLQNIDHQKQIKHLLRIEEEKSEKQKQSIKKAIDREKARLYNLRFDYEVEERRINKAVSEYHIEENEEIPSKENFFNETIKDISLVGDAVLEENFLRFQKKYGKKYLENIKKDLSNIDFFMQMYRDLIEIDNEKLKQARCKLLCLGNDFEELANNPINPKLLLPILCGYGTNFTSYYEVIVMLLTKPILYTFEKSDKLFVHYLNLINQKVIQSNPSGINLFLVINLYLDFVRDICESGKLHIKNPKLKRDEESKFINVVLYTFLKRHYDDFSIKGLSIKNIETFMLRLVYYSNTVNEEMSDGPIKDGLKSFDIKRLSLIGDRLIDVSSYIYLNYHLFSGIIDTLKNNIEKGYIFELPKSDQVMKLLKLLNECDYVKEYREVKNTDQIVGIFTNEDTYNWVVQNYWLGVYLTFNFNSNPSYCNIGFNNGNIVVRLYMIHELGEKIIICTGPNNDETYVNVDIIKNSDINEYLNKLNQNSFTIKINDIKTVVERLIEGNE